MTDTEKKSQMELSESLAMVELELNKYRLYESKLYLFLKALEVRDISELMNMESPYLVAVAQEIKKAAKGNAGTIANLMATIDRKNKTISYLSNANHKLARKYAAAVMNLSVMRNAITRALNDSETGEGWGPDVTVAAYLQQALDDVARNWTKKT